MQSLFWETLGGPSIASTNPYEGWQKIPVLTCMSFGHPPCILLASFRHPPGIIPASSGHPPVLPASWLCSLQSHWITIRHNMAPPNARPKWNHPKFPRFPNLHRFQTFIDSKLAQIPGLTCMSFWHPPNSKVDLTWPECITQHWLDTQADAYVGDGDRTSALAYAKSLKQHGGNFRGR